MNVAVPMKFVVKDRGHVSIVVENATNRKFKVFDNARGVTASWIFSVGIAAAVSGVYTELDPGCLTHITRENRYIYLYLYDEDSNSWPYFGYFYDVTNYCVIKITAVDGKLKVSTDNGIAMTK